MAIADKVETYTVHISQNSYLPYFRSIRLRLESGGTAFLAFPKERPADWLQFKGGGLTNVFMTADQFDSVYHVLQTESPVFFTALNLLGLQIGAVHTELDLAAGEPPGEGETDPQSLEALILLAQRQEGASA